MVDQLPVSSTFPTVTAVTWLPAKSVLGGEATDFTPWLAQPHILSLLGDALKLENLSTVAQEHPVLGKRLDILATAEDESGDEVPVCIENQYGISDASHLGRLIAYLAQHESGRAVWIVEEAHDAYVAAVRFLNRTASDEVGYYLVQVRFTHGADSGYQVHFEVLAAPIAWEKPSGGAKKPVNQGKVAWIRALHDLIRPATLGLGFPSMNAHARGAYIWVRWPDQAWIHALGRNLSIRARKDSMLVAVSVHSYATREDNRTAVTILEEKLSGPLDNALPKGCEVQWGTTQAGHREQVRVIRRDLGYTAGDVQEAASWSEAVVAAWMSVVQKNPITNLDAEVETRGGSATKAEDTDEDLTEV